MITVYPLVTEFCQQRNLPPPTQKDLNKIGIAIAFDFKNFYIKRLNLTPGTVLLEVGFLVQQEGDRKAVVVYYPEVYKLDMLGICEQYFDKKNQPKKPVKPQPPKQRKRTPIPGPLKPEFSAKPSTTDQRTF